MYDHSEVDALYKRGPFPERQNPWCPQIDLEIIRVRVRVVLWFVCEYNCMYYDEKQSYSIFKAVLN